MPPLSNGSHRIPLLDQCKWLAWDLYLGEKLLGSLTSRAYVMRYLADGMVGALSAEGFGSGRDPKRSQLALGGTLADDVDDLDGDEMEGMEMS
ncbi:hypothetical protein AFLA_001191 [Aspergillus flavus NRRL3357]|nr:hypothetical protein AFLA_001191 [Aspergillus flavus NRRL3357]